LAYDNAATVISMGGEVTISRTDSKRMMMFADIQAFRTSARVSNFILPSECWFRWNRTWAIHAI